MTKEWIGDPPHILVLMRSIQREMVFGAIAAFMKLTRPVKTRCLLHRQMFCAVAFNFKKYF